MKALCSIALMGGLLLPACAKDSRSELDSWRISACKCQDQACARKARDRFWKLVQDYRDDQPSKAEARTLNDIVEQGTTCLSGLGIDIYAPR